MSASTHLAQFNLTLQQAHDFVNANLGDLQLIFGIARQYGITTDMLGEIVGGYSGDQVSAYLTAHGLPGAELNPTPLFTDQLAALGGIISQDPYTGGILSVAALRERVVATTGAAAYDRAFNPDRYEGAADGVFTAAELGAASSLGTLAATSETMQSLFYGTVVRALTAIDFDESLQLSQFATQHLFDLQRGDGAVAVRDAAGFGVRGRGGASGDGRRRHRRGGRRGRRGAGPGRGPGPGRLAVPGVRGQLPALKPRGLQGGGAAAGSAGTAGAGAASEAAAGLSVAAGGPTASFTAWPSSITAIA